MTDETPDGDELDPDEKAGADLDNDGGDDDVEETPEEIKAQRDEFKRRLDKQRTAKAREARAAKRKEGSAESKKDDDAPNPLASELAAVREENKVLAARANAAQALSIASELGFTKPSGAVQLAKLNELEDASDADEVRAALREVAKEYPELRKQRGPKGDGGEGAGQSAGSKTSFNDIIRRAAGRA